VIGRDQLKTWATGLADFTQARARHDPARFYDVVYDDFVANPLGTVEAVYGHFGLALSGQAADAMRVLCEQSGGGREAWGRDKQSAGAAGPAHQYALSDFGLSAAQVDERFAGYFRARA
jgi:hypothetical protein